MQGTFDPNICQVVSTWDQPARSFPSQKERFFYINRINPPPQIRDDFRLDIINWNNITLFKLGDERVELGNFRYRDSIPNITPRDRARRRRETTRLISSALGVAKQHASACYR